jgi:hypothetical protein
MPTPNTGPLFKIRHSRIHGRGAFAVRPIPAGTRITEYQGQRISTAEADARYADADQAAHPHVLLFIVDKRTVIDAGVNGNAARFINHSCDPNCEVVIQHKRVFIDAICDMPAGAEITYDYNLEREDADGADAERRFSCRCGAPTCRGTMLAPKKTGRRRKPPRS